MTAAAPAQRPWRGAAERERLTHILTDPKSYFAEARRWAQAKARADLERELADAARKRNGKRL
ncbi:MAG: hypothetical protein ACRDTM_04015 [Micromonosporaceae bacterium]